MSFRIRVCLRSRSLNCFRFAPRRWPRAARRRRHSPGYPCRIGLTDAKAGGEVILVHYEHHAVASSFRSWYAIYVREGERHYDEMDRVPSALRCRLISLRAFDRDGMLLDADVADGGELESCIERLFQNPDAAYLQAHFAKPGCYAALIERA